MSDISLKDISIKDFCEKYHACAGGREWALSLGLVTMAELWQREDMNPEWRVWLFSRPWVASAKDQRLFAVWCARQVRHLLTDERSLRAIDVAERYANAEATIEELKEARDAAAAGAGAGAAAAAAYAADDASWEAARAAARAAAGASAGASARASARAAARAAARASAAAAQGAELLRRFPCLFEQ